MATKRGVSQKPGELENFIRGALLIKMWGKDTKKGRKNLRK